MAEEARRKTISIVIPLFNEEENIEELARRLQAVFALNAGHDFEVIAVENGSSDGTFAKLETVREADPRFKVVQLSRNFTADGGVTAGLSYATGDAAVIMCGDLQDPPELIGRFIEHWEQGYENVFQIVTKRPGTSLLRRFNSQAFYWVINAMTGGLFPRNVSDYRLVDRRVYETINGMREHNRFMRGLFYWTGFRSIGIEYERAARHAGESKANTRTVLALAIKGILSYSYLPLRFITYMGMAISALAFLLLVYEVVRILLYGVPFAGFGTLMTVMLIMFGFLFTMLGVVAEYIGLIYDEVKQRPNFIVKGTLGL
jgi:glycosyltransferase involved in cell wall biosynthesis